MSLPAADDSGHLLLMLRDLAAAADMSAAKAPAERSGSGDDGGETGGFWPWSDAAYDRTETLAAASATVTPAASAV